MILVFATRTRQWPTTHTAPTTGLMHPHIPQSRVTLVDLISSQWLPCVILRLLYVPQRRQSNPSTQQSRSLGQCLVLTSGPSQAAPPHLFILRHPHARLTLCCHAKQLAEATPVPVHHHRTCENKGAMHAHAAKISPDIMSLRGSGSPHASQSFAVRSPSCNCDWH